MVRQVWGREDQVLDLVHEHLREIYLRARACNCHGAHKPLADWLIGDLNIDVSEPELPNDEDVVRDMLWIAFCGNHILDCDVHGLEQLRSSLKSEVEHEEDEPGDPESPYGRINWRN
jgi:hypothetical protein